MLYIYQVTSSGMSIENAEKTITSLSESVKTLLKSSTKVIALNLLQLMSVQLEALSSLMPPLTQIESHKSPKSLSVLMHCGNLVDLLSICELQITIISGNMMVSTKSI